MRAGREAFPLVATSKCFTSNGCTRGNKEDTEKRLGRLLKRKTTKLFRVSRNLQLSPKALSEAWGFESAEKQSYQVSDF